MLHFVKVKFEFLFLFLLFSSSNDYVFKASIFHNTIRDYNYGQPSSILIICQSKKVHFILFCVKEKNIKKNPVRRKLMWYSKEAQKLACKIRKIAIRKLCCPNLGHTTREKIIIRSAIPRILWSKFKRLRYHNNNLFLFLLLLERKPNH